MRLGIVGRPLGRRTGASTQNEETIVAAADIFLTIKGPDIQGESLDKVHTNMIECLSFNWGESNLGSAGTGGRGPAGGGRAPAPARRRSATTSDNRQSCKVNERAHLPARASRGQEFSPEAFGSRKSVCARHRRERCVS